MQKLAERLLSLAETQRQLAKQADDDAERARLLAEANFHQQWAEREIGGEANAQ